MAYWIPPPNSPRPAPSHYSQPSSQVISGCQSDHVCSSQALPRLTLELRSLKPACWALPPYLPAHTPSPQHHPLTHRSPSLALLHPHPAVPLSCSSVVLPHGFRAPPGLLKSLPESPQWNLPSLSKMTISAFISAWPSRLPSPPYFSTSPITT